MRRGTLLLAVMGIAMPALAQAPAEDRRLPADAVTATQQRITGLLREMETADQALKRAELDARAAAESLAVAKKQSDGASRALRDAQDRSQKARQAYEAEAQGLQRLRRQGK